MRISLSGPLLSHPPADSAASLTICGALLQLFLPRGGQGSVRMGRGEGEEKMTTTNRVPRREGFPSPHVRRPLCEDLLCAACATRPGRGQEGARLPRFCSY